MARQFVNTGAEQPIKDAINALGGEASYAQVRDALIASGQGELVRDILGLHLAGRIPGVVRAQPDGSKPVLMLSLTPPQSNPPAAPQSPAQPAQPANPSNPVNPVG